MIQEGEAIMDHRIICQKITLIIILALLFVQPAGSDQTRDLPYDSGSNGQDGALVFPALPDGGRTGHVLASLGGQNAVLLMGGENDQKAWLWNEPEWNNAEYDDEPAPRQYATLTTFGTSDEHLLFGGKSSDRPAFSESWLLNSSGWTKLEVDKSPEGRFHHAAAYDKSLNRVIVHGGKTEDSPYNEDTWQWDGKKWISIRSETHPEARRCHAMAWHEKNEGIVLFGGKTKDAERSDETWVLHGMQWEQVPVSGGPKGREGHAMVFDALRGEIVMFGGRTDEKQFTAETWCWDGKRWKEKKPEKSPSPRRHHAMVFAPMMRKVLLFGGETEQELANADLWAWDGENWEYLCGKNQWFDMADKPNGLWNFTSIHIPAGVTVRFLKNEQNTPVRWLARDSVRINGKLMLDGADAEGENGGEGGPGGYDGGAGGTRFGLSNALCGMPGQGPGGGLPGLKSNQSGGGASHSSPGAPAKKCGQVYGNRYLQPLMGGSGGGGSGAGLQQEGMGGGGGGGAILIASSKDISINGTISACGGRGAGNELTGGDGSGGAIRLAADRIDGSGALKALGGTGKQRGGHGCIRLESYYCAFEGTSLPEAARSEPIPCCEKQAGQLRIVQLDGRPVNSEGPAGPGNPDAVISKSGEVEVTVEAKGIPDGVPVKLLVTHPDGVLKKPGKDEPAVVLKNGKAVFKLKVPEGAGSIQAYADYSFVRD
jgi:hypothetical protein